MEIISVSEENWQELKALRLESLKESPEAFSASYEVALSFSESQWRNRASDNEACKFFIAEVGSVLVGIVGGFYQTGEYELISLWVSPSYRKTGVAKKLLCATIEHAKYLGKNHIFLEVLSNNVPACELYKQCGFRLVSTRSSTENGIVRELSRFWLNFNA